MRKPLDMQILPYIKNDQIWSCPSDAAFRVPTTDGRLQWWDLNYRAKGIPRSYGYVSEIITAANGGTRDPNTGLSSYTGGACRPTTRPSEKLSPLSISRPARSLWRNSGQSGSGTRTGPLWAMSAVRTRPRLPAATSGNSRDASRSPRLPRMQTRCRQTAPETQTGCRPSVTVAAPTT
jgi:hypothetical protein